MQGHTSSSVRCALAALVLSAALPLSLSAADLSGELSIHYDDFLRELYVHGADAIADTVRPDSTKRLYTVPFSASVDEAGLVLGAVVENTGYTGALLMNIYTETDTLITNGWNWKWMIDPPQGWEQPTFDASDWPPVFDQGGADQSPTMVRDPSCINATDSCMLNEFIASGARIVWAPEDLYFRSTFTIDTACSASVWAGCRGAYTAYIDGQQVAHGDSADFTTEGRTLLTVGEHTIAIYATTTIPLRQGTGGALKAAVTKEKMVVQPLIDWVTFDTIGWDTSYAFRDLHSSDSTWKIWYDEVSGWQDHGFDDAGWIDADEVGDQIYPTGFPGTMELPGIKTIWLPQTIAFRGVVGGPDAVLHHATPQRNAVADIAVRSSDAVNVRLKAPATMGMELFGLDGRRVAVLLPKARRTAGSYTRTLPYIGAHLAILKTTVNNTTSTRMIQLGATSSSVH